MSLQVASLCVMIIATGMCYDIEEEIEYLRRYYGNEVTDTPCKGSSCSVPVDKRFLPNPTYCDAKLGCFPNDGAFADRPINFQPNPRAVIGTKFKLFTRSNAANSQVLNADDVNTIHRSLFDSKKKTKFIVHGFLESSVAKWFPQINDELLKKGDFNVINVDWGRLFASKTFYTQATANTRVVAAEIVYLIKTLQKTSGLKLSDVHIIGHSLGAHIAGYVGANFTGGIGRISGMDPASPYFQGYSPAIRLDETDALFVDVIHSDSDSILNVLKFEGGFGTKQLSGHADFFPNGGEDQPNCKNGPVTNIILEKDLYEGIKRLFACDHDRAVLYYIQSINSCPFTSFACSDYKQFNEGKCSISCGKADHCNSMGYGAQRPNQINKIYYLHTSGQGNFCVKGYQVAITMDKSSAESVGTMMLTVHDTKRTKEEIHLNKASNTFSPGSKYTYFIGVSTDLGSISHVEVTWTRDISWWKIITKTCTLAGLCSSINIKEITLTSMQGHTMRFCGNGTVLQSGTPHFLYYSSTTC